MVEEKSNKNGYGFLVDREKVEEVVLAKFTLLPVSLNDG